ncbi:Ulp1 protease family, C-terminal catalytic domain containing protein [Trema orientale]|uniref:Ulp1 protease family, C-terminal catalytic domain containing protein n=1 Tax=Trema orientale TaxID=63057 RepID=A0A2P5FTE6_TREOI|nr:Ulp1 protease family, C-terminal catalytic domain containing protein [Trema orientale]
MAVKPGMAVKPSHRKFWDLRKDYHIGDGYAPFKVEWAENVPQQDNGFDCGIFMIKFVEFLMMGEPIDKIQPNKIPFY